MMQKSQLESFNIEDDLKELVLSIFNGKMEYSKVFEVEQRINNLDPVVYKQLISEIFNHAKRIDFPLNKSEAKKFPMGVANWVARLKKNLKFRKRKDGRVIVAEGDSWFEHPFVKDIIDHLIEIVEEPIYTLAFGGDWIGNYLEEQKYLKALRKLKPHTFLLSGGGNDLVGNGRLSKLIHDRSLVNLDLSPADTILIEVYERTYGAEMAQKIVKGGRFLNDDFWTVRNLFLFQYLLIIRGIELEPELKDLKIITQGYDFAIPSNDKYNLFRKVLGHGVWLYEPMIKKNVTDPHEQHSIIAAMLFEFNEMLIYISSIKKSVYHVDCRGAAAPNEWNDELHLHSSVFKKIAKTYQKCIENTDVTQKVFVVKYG